ncbi:MAG: hypothetical protein QOI20_1143 [Acidimicrobiaceae bacterium]|jgi:hypothetical protein|nr:hypothetical protein [Acidimicrobiaceae bacterium]
MNPRRRLVFGVLAALLVVVGGAALAASLRGGNGSGDRSVRAATVSTTTTLESPASADPDSTSTTFDLRPETTTTARRPAAPSSTTVSTPSTTAAPLPVVTGAGAVLRSVSGPSSQMTSAGCKSLGDDGWSVECGTAAAKGGGTLVWLLEEKAGTPYGAPAARRVFVYAPAAGGSGGSGASGMWRVVLEARDEDASRWVNVTVKVVDVSGDGAEEIVVGFRPVSGTVLGIDVVEGPGAVTAHRDLSHGTGRVSPGQLDTWAAPAGSRGGPGDPYEHDVMRWQDGAWRVVLHQATTGADVPPSQF